MSDPQIDALDRDLDSLGAARAGRGRADDGVLGLLAQIRAAEWPDRAAGDRITAQVAAAPGLGRPVARNQAHAHLWRLDAEGAGRESGRPGSRRLTRPALLAVAAAVLTAAAAALFAAGVAVTGGHHRQPPVFHPRFTATMIAAGSRAAPVRSPARTWQLVSYLTGAGWKAGRVGASTNDLSCPSTAVCYMSAARPVPISGYNLPSPTYDILEVTKDGGADWSALELPPYVSILSPLQCPLSVTTCFASGTDAGRNVLLFTADGGRSWSARSTPAQAESTSELACTGNQRCVALFQVSGWAPGYYMSASNAVVMVTRDGGRSWSAGPAAPHGQLPDYLTCAGTTCVLFDQLITSDNSQSVNGSGRQTVAPGSWTAWYSHDGGISWQRGQHPASVWTTASHDLPNPGMISCSDRLHCWAAMSNQVGQSGIATAFAATTDGGVSWAAQQLPVQRAQQFIPLVMSCPTAGQCYAGGGDASGPVILTTVDGGAVWAPVSLPATHIGPIDTTGTLPAVGLLSCGAAARCVAALQSDGSAHSVPVYSLGAWQG
jgi:BNR/Asp-box repeat